MGRLVNGCLKTICFSNYVNLLVNSIYFFFFSFVLPGESKKWLVPGMWNLNRHVNTFLPLQPCRTGRLGRWVGGVS